MKSLLVVLAIMCSPVYAFQPNDLAGGEVKQVGECPPVNCAIVEKDGKNYLIVFVPTGDGENVYVVEVYAIKGKKLEKLWSFEWRDT